jgi:hypothetical protein
MNTGLRPLLLVVLAIGLGFSPVASAEDVNTTKHTHDGFMFRFTVGPSGGYFFEGDKSMYMVDTFSFGGSLNKHVTLHLGMGASIQIDDKSGQSGGTPMLLHGEVGASYYFNNNIHIDAAVGLGATYTGNEERKECNDFWKNCDEPEMVRETFKTMVLKAGVGKEWWVSDNWGIGIAADVTAPVYYTSTSDSSAYGLMFGFRFTATYN